MKSVYRHEWTVRVRLVCLDFSTATCNNTLCAKELCAVHARHSCTVHDKDGDGFLVCAGGSALFQMGAPREDWLLKVCQADQITQVHTTYTPSAITSSTATYVTLVQHEPSSLG